MPKRGNGEGSIYPYKNKAGKVIGYRGSYWIHTAEGPKRRYISGKKRENVRDKLAKALSQRADGLVFDAGAMTVGEYLDRWLADVRDTVRKSSHEGYEYAIEPHIKPALGRIKLKDLNPSQIRWFYRDRLDSGLSPATVHKQHVVLHKALKAAVADGLIPRNAAAGLSFRRSLAKR
jgi:integrase